MFTGVLLGTESVTHKGLKKSIRDLVRNAGTRISHFDVDLCALHPSGDLELATRSAHRLLGLENQIHQHLLKIQRFYGDLNVGYGHRQRDPVLFWVMR